MCIHKSSIYNYVPKKPLCFKPYLVFFEVEKLVN